MFTNRFAEQDLALELEKFPFTCQWFMKCASGYLSGEYTSNAVFVAVLNHLDWCESCTECFRIIKAEIECPVVE